MASIAFIAFLAILVLYIGKWRRTRLPHPQFNTEMQSITHNISHENVAEPPEDSQTQGNVMNQSTDYGQTDHTYSNVNAVIYDESNNYEQPVLTKETHIYSAF